MSMFYATTENDGNRISENASIMAFKTEVEARAWLLSFFHHDEWKKDEAVIEAGYFGDCWIKTYSEPKKERVKLIVGAFDCEPFTAEQIHVDAPGQHPGGTAWWITPMVDVLVISRIEPTA